MAGTVALEYIGDPDILNDHVKYRIMVGEIPPDSAQVLRGAQMTLSKRVEGTSVRRVDPEWFDTSRVYTFGPTRGTYVQEVEAADVDKILGSSSGHQFVRVDDPTRHLSRPQHGLKIIETVEGANLRSVFAG